MIQAIAAQSMCLGSMGLLASSCGILLQIHQLGTTWECLLMTTALCSRIGMPKYTALGCTMVLSYGKLEACLSRSCRFHLTPARGLMVALLLGPMVWSMQPAAK